eukprot:2448000-Amphidinium_carterae.1
MCIRLTSTITHVVNSGIKIAGMLDASRPLEKQRSRDCRAPGSAEWVTDRCNKVARRQRREKQNVRLVLLPRAHPAGSQLPRRFPSDVQSHPQVVSL